jgi:hypothetical protein
MTGGESVPSEESVPSDQSVPSDESVPGPATPPRDGSEPEGGATTGAPLYKGEPLEAERGPGLGCFWIQIALLTFFLIFTPLTVTWAWPPVVSAALLIFTLVLLLFSGQTIIFLLRLVAADRRTRRTPLDPSAKRTVGQMEDESPDAARPERGTVGSTTAAPALSDQGAPDEPQEGAGPSSAGEEDRKGGD